MNICESLLVLLSQRVNIFSQSCFDFCTKMFANIFLELCTFAICADIHIHSNFSNFGSKKVYENECTFRLCIHAHKIDFFNALKLMNETIVASSSCPQKTELICDVDCCQSTKTM